MTRIRLFTQIIVILLAPVLPALVVGLTQSAPQVETSVSGQLSHISPIAARQLDHVMWIDARSQAAFDAGHVPGALRLTPDRWEEQIEVVLLVWAPSTTVVVYCDGLACDVSQEVATRLKDDTGWEHVYVLEGGWSAWQEP